MLPLLLLPIFGFFIVQTEDHRLHFLLEEGVQEVNILSYCNILPHIDGHTGHTTEHTNTTTNTSTGHTNTTTNSNIPTTTTSSNNIQLSTKELLDTVTITKDGFIHYYNTKFTLESVINTPRIIGGLIFQTDKKYITKLIHNTVIFMVSLTLYIMDTRGVNSKTLPFCYIYYPFSVTKDIKVEEFLFMGNQFDERIIAVYETKEYEGSVYMNRIYYNSSIRAYRSTGRWDGTTRRWDGTTEGEDGTTGRWSQSSPLFFLLFFFSLASFLYSVRPFRLIRPICIKKCTSIGRYYSQDVIVRRVPKGSNINLPMSNINLPGSNINLPMSNINLPMSNINLPRILFVYRGIFYDYLIYEYSTSTTNSKDSPTSSPPTTSPILSPTSSPPTTSPILSPTSSPPTTSPILSPTSSPPTTSPILSPTSSPPTTSPILSPTSTKKDFLLQLVNAVKYLHSKEIIHGNICPENVRMSANTPILTDFVENEKWSMHVLSMENDIFSLGMLLHYFITGEDLFDMDEKKEITERKYKIKEKDPIVHDLIYHTINKTPEERTTAEKISNHPYFWTEEKTTSFLSDFSDRLEGHMNIIKRLERNKKRIFEGSWNKCIDKIIEEDIGTFRVYNYFSVKDLLRLIRNKIRHYNELRADVKEFYGSFPCGFIKYWTGKFPWLVIVCYNCAEEFKEEEVMKKYW